MPTYDYKCSSCGSVFEVKQKFADEPLTVHENCGGAVERLISAPALQFKGSGWYVTDYARPSSGSDAKSESGGTEKADKSDKSDKSDKTEKKADSATSTPAKAATSDAPAKS